MKKCLTREIAISMQVEIIERITFSVAGHGNFIKILASVGLLSDRPLVIGTQALKTSLCSDAASPVAVWLRAMVPRGWHVIMTQVQIVQGNWSMPEISFVFHDSSGILDAWKIY